MYLHLYALLSSWGHGSLSHCGQDRLHNLLGSWVCWETTSLCKRPSAINREGQISKGENRRGYHWVVNKQPKSKERDTSHFLTRFAVVAFFNFPLFVRINSRLHHAPKAFAPNLYTPRFFIFLYLTCLLSVFVYVFICVHLFTHACGGQRLGITFNHFQSWFLRFPAHTWPLTTIWNSNSRDSTLSMAVQVPGTHGVHRHPWDKTLIHIR